MCSVSGTVGTMESLFFSLQISFKAVLRTTFWGSWTGPRRQVMGRWRFRGLIRGKVSTQIH